MLEINFMPWRKERRAQRNKTALFRFAGIMFLLLLVVILSNHVVNGKITKQKQIIKILESYNEGLQQEVNEYKSLIQKKKNLLKKLQELYNLNKRQENIISVLQAMPFIITNKIKINKIIIDDSRLSLLSKAKDNDGNYKGLSVDKFKQLDFIKHPCRQVFIAERELLTTCYFKNRQHPSFPLPSVIPSKAGI